MRASVVLCALVLCTACVYATEARSSFSAIDLFRARLAGGPKQTTGSKSCLGPIKTFVLDAVKSLTDQQVAAGVKKFTDLLQLGDMFDYYKTIHTVTKAELDTMIGEAATCMESNPYLMDFICEATKNGWASTWANRLNKEVVVDAVLFSVFLDRATKAWIAHPDNIPATVNKFKASREKVKATRHFSKFRNAKLWAVEMGINSAAKAQQAGTISKKQGKVVFFINIMEAVLADFTRGYKDNAKAGTVLAVHTAGHSETNPKTGAGPTVFKTPSKLVSYNFPLTKEWDDLYTTWNMAFGSHYTWAPYIWAKLLAPCVVCYQKDPSLYLQHRGIALYFYLQWCAMASNKLDTENPLPTNWQTPPDEALTKHWGEINNKHATEYKAKVKELDPPLATRIAKEITKATDEMKAKAGEIRDSVVDTLKSIGDKISQKAKAFWNRLTGTTVESDD